MSIPQRIWRLVRGRWLLAEEQVRDALAEEAAVQELDETTRLPPSSAAPQPLTTGRISAARRNLPPASGRRIDPLAADLALLGAPPACDIETLDRLYAERLAELQPDRFPAGSTEHDEIAARRTTLSETYERLRDAINTTETRFERLEF
jgi:hypothetical protein